VRLTLRLLLCLGLLLSQPVGAGNPRQEELEQLRERIRSMQQALEKTTENKSEAADSLRDSERAISNSNRALADLAEQKRNSNQELEQLGRRSAQIGQDMEGQQALLGKLLYQQYVGGQHEYLRLLFNGRNPNQIARDLSYYEYIARDRAAWLDKLRANLAQLASVTEQTRDKRAQIVALQREEQTQKAKLEQEKGAHQKVLIDLAQKLKQQRREIARMQENESRLSKLMEQLAKLRAKPRSKERAPTVATPATPARQNDKLPDDRHDGSSFAQLRGKLALPVKGAISNQFGATRPDSTMQWKGLFMRAAAGQPVKAVAAGQVVYADWLRGFGNLLIVDHGDGYMSLYGNNETLYKQVGDELRGGDTVAAVGNSGGNETSGLYFELRHEGKPFDPMKWVSGR
jgi:septal ring factor EnvC (AmiA/AmiB activator)